MFRDVVHFWKETWRQSKALFLAEMIGAIGGMIGAGNLCFMAPDPNLLISFTAYIISSISLMYSCYVRKSSWMLILMIFYTVTTAIGLWRIL